MWIWLGIGVGAFILLAVIGGVLGAISNARLVTRVRRLLAGAPSDEEIERMWDDSQKEGVLEHTRQQIDGLMRASQLATVQAFMRTQDEKRAATKKAVEDSLRRAALDIVNPALDELVSRARCLSAGSPTIEQIRHLWHEAHADWLPKETREQVKFLLRGSASPVAQEFMRTEEAATKPAISEPPQYHQLPTIALAQSATSHEVEIAARRMPAITLEEADTVIPAFVKNLDNPDQMVAFWSALGLAQIDRRSVKATIALVAATASPYPIVRDLGWSSLAELPDGEVSLRLAAAASDHDPVSRDLALRARSGFEARYAESVANGILAGMAGQRIFPVSAAD